jgi:Ca2+-binding EF-hand superfamily protein
MRKATVLGVSLSLVVLLCELGSAQQNPPANPVQTVLQLDANGDMAIERDEVPDSGHAAFDRLLKLGDHNKNGKLDADEIRAMGQKLRNLPAAGIVARFKSLDKDGDGKVSKDEFDGPEARFAQLDADKDGFITQREANQGAANAVENLRKNFDDMDKNSDGKLSAEEFTGPRPLFVRVDTDKDGFITKEEVAKAPTRPNAAPASAKPKATAAEPSKKEAPANGGGGKRIKAMDKDGDGKVSRAEFTGPPRMFDRLDLNHDGVLGVDDLLNRRAPGKVQAKKMTKP